MEPLQQLLDLCIWAKSRGVMTTVTHDETQKKEAKRPIKRQSNLEAQAWRERNSEVFISALLCFVLQRLQLPSES